MFYVYILLRPDLRPFYVGKGSGDRIHAHEQEARTKCACHKCKVIRKVWRSGKQIVKRVVFETRVEAKALAEEARLIHTIGIHNLTNVSLGATGFIVGRVEYTEPRIRNLAAIRAHYAYVYGERSEEFRREWYRILSDRAKELDYAARGAKAAEDFEAAARYRAEREGILLTLRGQTWADVQETFDFVNSITNGNVEPSVENSTNDERGTPSDTAS